MRPTVRQRFTRRQALCYVLPDFEKVLEQIDKQVYRKVTDSTVRFDGNFTYTEGQDGKQVDVDKLCPAFIRGKDIRRGTCRRYSLRRQRQPETDYAKSFEIYHDLLQQYRQQMSQHQTRNGKNQRHGD